MKQNLTAALMTSIEALQQVPGTQLQHIESTLRQLYTDLKKAGITPPAELDDLIEEAAIGRAEDMAYMNGVAWGDEPELQPYPDFTEEEMEEFYRMDFYEKYGCYPDEPKAQNALSNMLRDMFPEDGELPF